MEIYSDIELNTELEELASRGVHKGCNGIILEIIADTCIVLFFNNLNRGDYACCNVNKRYLDVCNFKYGKDVKELKKLKITCDLTKDCFKPQKFLEYDLVELAVEKDEYAREGAHRGARGAVMESYCINSRYMVIFTDEKTGLDIADLSVHEDDLILIKR